MAGMGELLDFVDPEDETYIEIQCQPRDRGFDLFYSCLHASVTDTQFFSSNRAGEPSRLCCHFHFGTILLSTEISTEYLPGRDRVFNIMVDVCFHRSFANSDLFRPVCLSAQ